MYGAGAGGEDPTDRQMDVEGGRGRTEVQREKGVEETEPRPQHTGTPVSGRAPPRRAPEALAEAVPAVPALAETSPRS